MNAITGNGIIFAILCAAVDEPVTRFIFGTLAMIMGAMGIAIYIADRTRREKQNDKDHHHPSGRRGTAA